MSTLTITNEDNMELMKRYPDNYFDLAIVDPPYGIDIEQRVFKDDKKWDSSIPSLEYFNELKRVSKNQIIWGGNYFLDYLGNTRSFVIYDKKITDKHTYSMCEFAWTSFNYKALTYYTHQPGKNGFFTIEDRIHPTQKPIKLYKFLLKHFTKPNDKILDTHLGSGSIAIAFHDYGFDLTACELDKEYFDKAMERIKNHVAQQKLF